MMGNMDTPQEDASDGLIHPATTPSPPSSVPSSAVVPKRIQPPPWKQPGRRGAFSLVLAACTVLLLVLQLSFRIDLRTSNSGDLVDSHGQHNLTRLRGADGGRPPPLPTLTATDDGGRTGWEYYFLPSAPAPGNWPIAAARRLPRQADSTNLTVSTLAPSLVQDTRNDHLSALIASMHAQTVPANEIILVVSNFKDHNRNATAACRDLHAKLRASQNDDDRTGRSPLPPLRLVCVGERLTAGRARNVAARLAAGDVLSFIDADDTELPRRNEVTTNLFGCYPALKIVLHGYIRGAGGHKYDLARRKANSTDASVLEGSACADEEEGLGAEGLEVVRGAALHDILGKTHQRWWIRGDLAHGHMVVRADVWWDAVRFTSLAKGEDSLFVRDVLYAYGRDDEAAMFINRPLTSYLKSNQANKDLLT